jgi:rhodanese-related sulfurtransferase
MPAEPSAERNDDRLRLWRLVAIVALGSTLGLAWNAVSGHGFALSSNVYVRAGEEEVQAADAKARLEKGALMLDARPVWSYELGHIPGALPLPEEEFDKHFALLEPQLRASLDVIVYCSGFGCEASHLVARKLKQRGIPAAVLHEGWPAWTEAGYPTRTGAQP